MILAWLTGLEFFFVWLSMCLVAILVSYIVCAIASMFDDSK